MLLKYCLIFLMLFAQQLVSGQDKPIVRIAKFYEDKSAAVCYAFDDGLLDQAEIAVPLLEKYGFTGTFFIIPSQISENNKKEGWGRINWTTLKKMAANGHEISNHSWSHKNMKTLSDKELIQEIEMADNVILEKIGQKPVTFAYPYNSFDERVHNAVFKDHIAAREFQFGIGTHFTTQQGNVWVEKLVKDGNWGITMIHGISKGFDFLSSPKVLDDHFKFVKNLESDVWVSTFSNIIKYVHERDSSAVGVQYKRNKIICHLSNKLNTLIYNQPLTLIIEVENASSVEARQLGKLIPVKVFKDKILVNAMTGSGSLRLKWINTKEKSVK